MLAALTFSLLAQIVSTPTHCLATPVVLDSEFTDWQLVGCDSGYADNLAWALDRSDSRDGSLDGRVLRHTTGAGAVVYVIDSGIKADHDEFIRPDGSVVIAGLDVASADGFPPPCPGLDPALQPCYQGAAISLRLDAHGTGVASVIAGLHTGIAPGAKLVSVCVLGVTGTSTIVYVDALDAIRRHAFDPASPPFRTAIVNISGGLPDFKKTTTLDRFMAKLRDMIGGVDRDGNPDPSGKRFLFVVAAGNIGTTIQRGYLGECNPDGTVAMFPAVYGASIDGLVTAGGSDAGSNFWSGSCGGAALDLAAPATEQFVASITAHDRFRDLPDFFRNGTSYSAPYVSGIAARMLEADPSLTPVELEQRLKASPSLVNGMNLPIPFLIDTPVPPRRRAAGK